MDILWTEKYKPQKSDEILGNNKIIELMEICGIAFGPAAGERTARKNAWCFAALAISFGRGTV